MKKRRDWIFKMVCLLIAAFICIGVANSIQKDHGNVEITNGVITVEDIGSIYYKQYTPKTASAETPAPGVLLLHGYQNDHETCAAYAIELARRGAVVIVPDEFGHGWTKPGMALRGWTDHKVTVNFGNESKEDGTYVQIGGANRYKLMMNFSNLDFFDSYYSKGSDGSAVKDSSMGGIFAYSVLAKLPYVDNTRLAVSGHSMGTWASWSVAAYYAGVDDGKGHDITPKAVVLQCGELFRDTVYDHDLNYFNNVLLLQAKYDEFSYFRDYANTVSDELLKTPLRTEFLGTTADKAAWNTTYGSFADGSARRIELLNTNHRLTTHNKAGLAEALDWFDQAIDLPTSLKTTDQVAMVKEWLVLAAMLMTIGAAVMLMETLLTTKFFAKEAIALPSRFSVKNSRQWNKGFLITVLLAAATYPFMTQLGHGLLPLPEKIFRMTVGNGFVSWYGLLILIMLGITFFTNRKAKKKGQMISWHNLGLGSDKEPDRISWKLLGRGALLAAAMMFLMYAVVYFAEELFELDLRFIWPFFKTFTAARFGQFFVYLPFFALFYILNNSKIFAGLRTEATYEPGFKGFLACWWRYALVMVGGTLIVILIEYVPFFLGIGPGADVLFGSTFGGPFMSLLILFAPQVLVFSILGTRIYRRTGNVYTGAWFIAMLACWIVTGGSAML